MEEARIRHIEMVQQVISRLAGNSFSLRGWSVVMVSAIFALSAKEADAAYLAVALLPSLAFCFLDAYYLWQERLFRALYKACIEGVDIPLFSMNTSLAGSDETYLGALNSPTVLGFHMPVMLTVVAVAACTYLL